MAAHTPLDRRAFMAYFSGLGLSGTLFPGVLWARVQQGTPITKDVIDEAEQVAGLEFTDEERDLMVENLNRNLEGYKLLRAIDIPNQVRPALSFDPAVPESALPRERRPLKATKPKGVQRPANLEALAFRPVTELAELVRTRKVTSTELTRMYLDRLKRHGPTLECVIELTEDRALAQAAAADREIAAKPLRRPIATNDDIEDAFDARLRIADLLGDDGDADPGLDHFPMQKRVGADDLEVGAGDGEPHHVVERGDKGVGRLIADEVRPVDGLDGDGAAEAAPDPTHRACGGAGVRPDEVGPNALCA